MKYNAKSAEVLNEADRFQRQMDIQLLGMEQKTLLWGYNKDTDWIPGNPIYKHPAFGGVTTDNGDVVEGTYYGNYPRPLIELIPDKQETRKIRCADCDVSWGGDDVYVDTCWVCGKEVPPDNMGRTLAKYSFPDIMRFDYNPSFDMQMLTYAARDAAITMDLFRLSVSHVADTWASFGFTHPISVVSVEVPRETIDIAIGRKRPTNPFKREDISIELIGKVYADLSKPVMGGVRLPRRIDLSGHVPIEAPVMPEVVFVPPQEPTWVRFNQFHRRESKSSGRQA